MSGASEGFVVDLFDDNASPTETGASESPTTPTETQSEVEGESHTQEGDEGTPAAEQEAAEEGQPEIDLFAEPKAEPAKSAKKQSRHVPYVRLERAVAQRRDAEGKVAELEGINQGLMTQIEELRKAGTTDPFMKAVIEKYSRFTDPVQMIEQDAAVAGVLEELYDSGDENAKAVLDAIRERLNTQGAPQVSERSETQKTQAEEKPQATETDDILDGAPHEESESSNDALVETLVRDRWDGDIQTLLDSDSVHIKPEFHNAVKREALKHVDLGTVPSREGAVAALQKGVKELGIDRETLTGRKAKPERKDPPTTSNDATSRAQDSSRTDEEKTEPKMESKEDFDDFRNDLFKQFRDGARAQAS